MTAPTNGKTGSHSIADTLRRKAREPSPLDPETIEIAARDARDDERHEPRRDERWKWAPPLEQFLGDEEPSDDDAEDWIIRDIVPRGEAFLIGGAWKSGKTWTAIGLAVCIALGRPFLSFENTLGRPGRVLVIALEDSRRRLRKRVWQVLRGMGLTPNDATLREHLRIWDEAIRIPGEAKTLAMFVAELGRWRPDVVIVDSLTRVIAGSQNDIRDATAFTAAWRELGINLTASIGFLHHTNKSNGDKRGNGPARDAFDNMRGSGELLAAPRNLIVMERIGEDGSHVSAVSMRGNLELRRASFALEWIQAERDGRTVVTLVDRGDPDELRAEVAERRKDEGKAKKAAERCDRDDVVTQRALLTARDRGSCSASTLATLLGVSRATAGRYLKQRRDLGLLEDLAGNEGTAITPAGRVWLAERSL